MSFIRKIGDIAFDIRKLRGSLLEIESSISWAAMHNQISLVQARPEGGISHPGHGSLYYQYGHHGRKAFENINFPTETDFNEFRSELKSTYFYFVYNFLKDYFAETHYLTRARLMRLNPMSLIGWHRDLEDRIHVPIITNNACRIVCETEAHFLPADGSCYWMNSSCQHTAMNASRTKPRIHLVIQAIPK